MKRAITLAVVLFVTISLVRGQIETEEDRLLFERFEEFMEKYQKVYPNSIEMMKRFEIFKTNLNLIKEISDKDEKESSFGMTQFMDLSTEEFKQKYMDLSMTNLTIANQTDHLIVNETAEPRRFLQSQDVPASFDWRAKGVTTPVKTQGNYCGSCWAFSAVAALESQISIKTGVTPILSVQQLVDCDRGNYGCNGGLMHTAFKYIQNYGIEDAKSYPYQWSAGTCRFKQSLATHKIGGYYYAGTTDEEQIKAMLFKYGPLTVTINADLLQWYSGGVLNVAYYQCPYKVTHAVVLEGYGTTALGVNYWIVRNSWGPNWGERGYFRLARGKGLCGVNQYVVFPFL